MGAVAPRRAVAGPGAVPGARGPAVVVDPVAVDLARRQDAQWRQRQSLPTHQPRSDGPAAPSVAAAAHRVRLDRALPERSVGLHTQRVHRSSVSHHAVDVPNMIHRDDVIVVPRHLRPGDLLRLRPSPADADACAQNAYAFQLSDTRAVRSRKCRLLPVYGTCATCHDRTLVRMRSLAKVSAGISHLVMQDACAAGVECDDAAGAEPLPPHVPHDAVDHHVAGVLLGRILSTAMMAGSVMEQCTL